MNPPKNTPAQAGITVSTAINAGASGHRPTVEPCAGCGANHAEGIVVDRAIAAGLDGASLNHAETLVVL